MNPVSPKVTGGSAGASVAGALSVVLVWLLTKTGMDVPPDIAAAITTLIAAAGTYAGAYYSHDPMREQGAGVQP